MAKLLLKTTFNLSGNALFLWGENLCKTLFYLIDVHQNVSNNLSNSFCLSSGQRQMVFTYVVNSFSPALGL